MNTNIHNSLILTPTPRIAQVIVGSLSFLFLIHLPASAAMLRRGVFFQQPVRFDPFRASIIVEQLEMYNNIKQTS